MKNLLALRKKRAMSVRDVAIRLKVSEEIVRKLEAGEGIPGEIASWLERRGVLSGLSIVQLVFGIEWNLAGLMAEAYPDGTPIVSNYRRDRGVRVMIDYRRRVSHAETLAPFISSEPPALLLTKMIEGLSGLLHKELALTGGSKRTNIRAQ